MKKLLLLVIVLLFAVIRCGDEILNPAVTLNFIALPSNLELADTTEFEYYYMMHGSYGTTIQFNRQFVGGPFSQYTISATMVIDSGTIASSDSLLCLLSVGATNTSAMVSPLEPYFTHQLG